MTLIYPSCAEWCVCVSESQAESDSKEGKRENVCVVLTGRWSLSLSLEVFHFTPHYTRLIPSACCLSFIELLHPLPLSLPRVSLLTLTLIPLCLSALLAACWVSGAISADWSVVACVWVWNQQSDVLSSVLHHSRSFCITHSVTETVCISKAPAYWEGSKPSGVSKELLRWNPPSKDTWQPFTATRDWTFTDPTIVLPLLVSNWLFLTGHSGFSLSCSFYRLFCDVCRGWGTIFKSLVVWQTILISNQYSRNSIFIKLVS